MKNEYSDEEGRKKEGKMRGRGEMRVNSIAQRLLVSFSSFLPVLFISVPVGFTARCHAL